VNVFIILLSNIIFIVNALY